MDSSSRDKLNKDGFSPSMMSRKVYQGLGIYVISFWIFSSIEMCFIVRNML